MKNVTGLDLSKLLCGSFGTLGVLTEVVLKTLPAMPCQITLAFQGLSMAAAVAIFSEALATPYEVSGAAFHASNAWLRLEGREGQLNYRCDRLRSLFSRLKPEIVDDSDSRALWRRLSDVEHFRSSSAPLWRILVRPTDAPEIAGALERLSGNTSLDWGGGLVWYCGDADPERVRAAASRGHATVIRQGGLLSCGMFHRQAATVAAISTALRRTFDPVGILNPGLMDP